MDALRAVALTGLLVACAVPTGAAALRAGGFERCDFYNGAERWILAITAGLGLFALLYTLLGLGRVLFPAVVLALPLATAVVTLPPGRSLLARSPSHQRSSRRVTPVPRGMLCRVAGGVTRVALVALSVAVLIQDLAPPTDYDGLLYHLVAPRAFLAAHGIVYLPDNFSANLPALGEMLYVFGLAGGSDRAPQLLHGVAGGLACGLTYTFGVRFFGRRPAAWGAAGLTATPLVPFLATRAYIDLFTVLFGLVALFGVIHYAQSSGRGGSSGDQARWLRLAGAGAGLALATKYSALTLVAVLAVATLAISWNSRGRSSGATGLSGARRPGASLVCGSCPREDRARFRSHASWKVQHPDLGFLRVGLGSGRPDSPATTRWKQLGAALRSVTLFGAVAALMALPWYARQALILGNPVWPMYFGGLDWDAMRVEQLTYFVAQYGTGHGWADRLLLPWNVYAHSWRFGHVPEAYPPLLALAAPLALLVPRSAGGPVSTAQGASRWLLVIVAATALLWAGGLQDLRFLLTLYPALALLGAAGLDALIVRWPAARRRESWVAGAVAAFVAALCLTTAARQVARAQDAAGVVFGREAVAAFLGRRLPDFAAITVLNRLVPDDKSVLFLGDGQIWYCRPRCLPDPAHDNLLEWFIRPGDASAVLARLQREGVSHILLSKVDYWYLEHQDPQDRLRRQLAQFYVFKAAHLDLVYEDAWTEVYRGRW
ncbi:MAG: glycosyltransferase family 39 protein [Chloroflexota bacterium]|nr:glycosyltransferase family 39 protein [Chloroflexota bacterium]